MRRLTLAILLVWIAAALGMFGRTSLRAAGPDDQTDVPGLFVKNEIEGRTTIHYIVSNGRHVRKGALLVELDSPSLKDKLAAQTSATMRAQALLEQAKGNLRVRELFVRDYQERTYPEDRDVLKKEIARAQSALDLAEDRLEAAQKDANQDALATEQAELDRESARLDLQEARKELEVLETFTRPFIEDRLLADVAANQADIQLKQVIFELEQAKKTMLQQRVAQCKVRSPLAGEVIHSPSDGRDELTEGDVVRKGQEILRLIPDQVGEKP